MKKKVIILAIAVISLLIIATGVKLFINFLNTGANFEDTNKINTAVLSNLEPMYGNTGPVDMRTSYLKKIDEEFIKNATGNGQISRADASMYITIVGGWGYYLEKDFETSVKRFNQSWLLNSENYQNFWGFGLLLMEQKRFDKTIEMFDRALELYAKDNQKEVLKPWYEKRVDESILTQQGLKLKRWIDSMYESSDSLILCDLANAYLKKATDIKNDSLKKQYINKATELINKATDNGTITKNLDNCYKILEETKNAL